MRIRIEEKWNNFISTFPQQNRDIYFKEEYVKLYEDKDNRAVCVVVDDGKNMLLFPFLRRSFEVQGKIFYDFETAYGYGGPIYKDSKDTTFIHSALKVMNDFLTENAYVAGFIRFHPLLHNEVDFCIGKVIHDRKTIAMNLTLSVNELWMNEIHTKNRNIIKKGDKSGLRFIVDTKYEHLDEFEMLYNSTMDKLNADDFYYFSDLYYKRIGSVLPNSFLGLVECGNKIISSAIFMYDGEYGHYHLSGSDITSLKLSPNNFMLYHAALELKKRGVKLFHLGGGTTSDEMDPLYCFKSRFSKSTYDFYIGKLIFNESIYDTLCSEWLLTNPEKVGTYRYYLLKYKY